MLLLVQSKSRGACIHQSCVTDRSQHWLQAARAMIGEPVYRELLAQPKALSRLRAWLSAHCMQHQHRALTSYSKGSARQWRASKLDVHKICIRPGRQLTAAPTSTTQQAPLACDRLSSKHRLHPPLATIPPSAETIHGRTKKAARSGRHGGGGGCWSAPIAGFSKGPTSCSIRSRARYTLDCR